MASFTGAAAPNPFGGLVLVGGTTLYGTTQSGGAQNFGTVFRYVIGGALTTLYSFDGTHGATPQGGLALGNDGALYGTTRNGGTNGYGTAFRLTTNANYTVLASFNFSNPGGTPLGGLTLGADATTNFLRHLSRRRCQRRRQHSPARSQSGRLHQQSSQLARQFQQYHEWFAAGRWHHGGPGWQPLRRDLLRRDRCLGLLLFNARHRRSHFSAGAVQQRRRAVAQSAVGAGAGWKFYGTTYSGGPGDSGTIYRISTNGTPSVLSSFTSATGIQPDNVPAVGPDGNLYGTTSTGGAGGGGTIYRFSFDRITSIAPTGSNALISATGTTGGSYALYATTNLASGTWTNLVVATATNSLASFTDTNAGKFPQRFYRTAAQ